MAVLLIDFKNF